MRTSTAVIVAVSVLGLFGCNKADRYPISARSADGGNVGIHGDYNRCPQVIFVATPDHVTVGRPILLMAIASDQDGDQLSYAWTATAGTISDPTAPTTSFECARNGDVTITLTVRDDSCPSATSGVVLCQPGDGGTDDGGPDGGAGGRGGGGGGQTGTGGTTGLAGVGGSGMAGTGPGGSGGMATGAGGSSGSTGAGGSSGNGGASSGGRGGSSGGGAAGSGPCIETNPPQELAADCTACLNLNQNPITDGCCNITNDPLGVQLCQAASACMRTGSVSGAPCNNMGDTGTCYCGTSGTCSAGGANGPCVQQIAAAAGRNVVTHVTDTPTPAQTIQRYGLPDFAIGRAGNIQTVAGAFCPAECGY